MVDPASGPFLFDTSAESWLARSRDSAVRKWLRAYLARHQVHVSSITVLERIRGYALVWRAATPERRLHIESARIAYLRELGRVWAVDAGVAVVAAEIMALVPEPPSPPRRTHRLAEPRQERLVRWRLDAIIASTALVAGMLLIHNNPADFETIRGAIERSPRRFPGLGPLKLVGCGRLV
jgi:predicted nucleic acid-binding protein